MATYNPQQLDIKPPEGGFKQGGWYSGRQYWGGTLSEPGKIHPQSNQVGAGEAVSEEVTRASSIAAGEDPEAFGEFIAKERAKTTPQSTDELTRHLNRVQAGLKASRSGIETLGTEGLRDQLTQGMEYPERLDRREAFEDLRAEQGLAGLEEQLNELKKQGRDTEARLRERKATERGKRVPMNVIQGRLTEVERQEREELDFIQRQQQRITDQLNTGYKLVSMYMDFMGQDYDDAVAEYNTKFKQNVQVYNLMQQERKEAKANLQMYANAITSGNLSYDNLSMDQKVDIAKLEAQAGMPVGFVSSLNLSPKDQLITMNEKTGEALIMDSGGNMQVVQTGLTPTGGGGSDLSESDESEYNQKATNQFLTTYSNNYGHVPPQVYNDARREWINAGEDPDEFDRVFRTYRDPNRTDNAYNVEQEKSTGYYGGNQ